MAIESRMADTQGSTATSVTEEEKDLSVWAQRRNATDRMAVLASAGNLNESVAAKSMSKSL